jgi:hypothetical protein
VGALTHLHGGFVSGADDGNPLRVALTRLRDGVASGTTRRPWAIEEAADTQGGAMPRARKLAVAILAAMTVAALGATPAAADQPVRTQVIFDDLTINDQTCGFLIVEVFDGTVTTTTFFDAEGDPVRSQVQAFFQGTLTNPATGESVRGQQQLVIFRDFEVASERTWAGLRFRAVFPGAGALLLDAGRLVFDVVTGEVSFEGGPHQVFHEDFEAYCAAFSS